MKRIALTVVSCLAGAVAGSAVAGSLAPGQVEIALHAQVSTAHRIVTLGEAASLRTTDLDTIRQLVNLPLGEAPRAGVRLALQRDALARWIRVRTGIEPERIVWSGASQAEVATGVQRLAAANVEAVARKTLEAWLASRTTRFTLERTGPIQALELPPGAVALQARALPAEASPSKRMLVWVDVNVDGAYVRTLPVSFDVEAYRQAWVAAGDAAAGAPLDAGRMQPREVPVTAEPQALVPPGRPGELQAVRRLSAGEPLTASNTRHLPAVRRGDVVALQFHSGGLRLESRAEALQEGDPGESVQVRMAGAQASIVARVVEAGKVEVMP